MAKYLVTSEPGIYRHGEPFYRTGSLLEMPDSENPPTGVKPLDPAAQQAIQRANKVRFDGWPKAKKDSMPPHEIERMLGVPALAANPVEEAKAKKEEGQTLKEAARSAGLDMEPNHAPAKPRRERSL